MKKITKTIGYISVAFALWHTPQGKAITVEQINAFTEACWQKSIQNLETLLTQEERRIDPIKRTKNTECIRKFLEDYNKKRVYYDLNGDFVIETVNFCNSSVNLADFLKYAKKGSGTIKNGNPLDAISKELSANTLNKRGIDINEIKDSDIQKVREITFQSIMESSFFNKEQRDKCEKWFHDADALKAAVENYAEHYVPFYLEHKTFKISLRNTEIYTNYAGDIQIMKEPDLRVFAGDTLEVPSPADEAITIKQKIKSVLECMFKRRNGKEKVILFLLLDEMTPLKDRCTWMWGVQNGGSSGFLDNTFMCNPDDIEWSLSHEIGHYLQYHLGLNQTHNDYQSSLAQELLLLKNDFSNDCIFKIPASIQKKVSTFDGTSYHHQQQQQLSLKTLFEYCQLVARWTNPDEISNILGVYFKGDTLYIHALSDIRELRRIRYGHAFKRSKEAIAKSCASLKNESIEQLLTSICNDAFERPVPTKALRLLCRLHQRKNPDEDAQNVVCDFDFDSSKHAEEIVPFLSDFIEAE